MRLEFQKRSELKIRKSNYPAAGVFINTLRKPTKLAKRNGDLVL
jgi:hypothetical protein